MKKRLHLHILFVMAFLALVISAGAALTCADTAGIRVKPSDLKVENKFHSTEATFSWKNPWPDNTFGGSTVVNEYGCWGMKIDKSEDGKKTWKDCVKIFGYNYGSSYYGKTSDSATLEHGKTYYFRAYYYDQDENPGPMVYIGPVKWTTESGEAAEAAASEKADIIKKIKNKGKVTKTGGYGATNPIKKGMKVVYNRGAYKLTVSVKSVSSGYVYGHSVTNATFNCEFEKKIKQFTPDIYSADKSTNSLSNVWKEAGNNKWKAEFTQSFSDDLGCKRLKFVMMYAYNYSEVPSTATEYFDFAVVASPGALTLGEGGVTTTKNTISLKNLPENTQKVIYYRKKGASKWSSKTVSGTSTSITKLKANTAYQVRYRCKTTVTSSGGSKKTVSSAYSGTLDVRTQVATAPVVASVSTSGAHYVNKWVPGKWVNTTQGKKWQAGHQDNYTGFTVKVTMKKPSGVYGFRVKNYGTPTKGATLTFGASKAGNCKGSTFTFQIASYTNSTPDAGMSPWRTVSVTIR